jgi:para-aminobenzoate synthetase/4-amino-4-deoxychorismate lyase
VAISRHCVAAADPFLYHKTTRRELFDAELRAHPGCYDIIFANERDQVTEGSYNTVVVSLRGELLTPPLECGLLPGVMREELLEVGAIREAVLTVDDLRGADRLWLVNSVRGWRECTLQNIATEDTEDSEKSEKN